MPVTGYCEPLASRQTVQHRGEWRYMCDWDLTVIRRGRVRGRSERRREVRKECDMGGGEGGWGGKGGRGEGE